MNKINLKFLFKVNGATFFRSCVVNEKESDAIILAIVSLFPEMISVERSPHIE